METNNIEEILEEIRYHQSQSYLNWISAWARKIKVDRLHSRLDQLGYNGQRPPRSWNQLLVKKIFNKSQK